jgi:hypothetical protein
MAWHFEQVIRSELTDKGRRWVEPYGSADVAIEIDSKEIVVTYDVQPDHPFRFQLETQGVPTNVSFTDSEPLAERLRTEGFDVDRERRRERWSDITGLFLGVPLQRREGRGEWRSDIAYIVLNCSDNRSLYLRPVPDDAEQLRSALRTVGGKFPERG